MRRIRSLCICLLLLFLPLTTLSAQTVQWSDWYVTRQASCTADGEQQRISTSGQTESRVIPATGHVFDEIIYEGNCVAGGRIERTCKLCGFSETLPHGEPLGHMYVETTIIYPSCGQEGIRETTCARCGDVKREVTPALTHSYTDWIVEKEPTLSADGRRYRECIHCGSRINEVLPAAETETVTLVVNTFKEQVNSVLPVQASTTPEETAAEEKKALLGPVDIGVISLNLVFLALFIFLIWRDAALILWDKRERKKNREAFIQGKDPGENYDFRKYYWSDHPGDDYRAGAADQMEDREKG